MRIDQTPAPARADRLAIARPATLRDPARSPVDVTIENLSETGALLVGEGDLPVGSLVSLGIAGIGIQVARIARTEPGRFACEFMLPIDPGAIARARSAETLVSVAFPQMRPAAAPVVAPPVAIPPVAAPVPRGFALPVVPIVAIVGLVGYLLLR